MWGLTEPVIGLPTADVESALLKLRELANPYDHIDEEVLEWIKVHWPRNAGLRIPVESLRLPVWDNVRFVWDTNQNYGDNNEDGSFFIHGLWLVGNGWPAISVALWFSKEEPGCFTAAEARRQNMPSLPWTGKVDMMTHWIVSDNGLDFSYLFSLSQEDVRLTLAQILPTYPEWLDRIMCGIRYPEIYEPLLAGHPKRLIKCANIEILNVVLKHRPDADVRMLSMTDEILDKLWRENRAYSTTPCKPHAVIKRLARNRLYRGILLLRLSSLIWRGYWRTTSPAFEGFHSLPSDMQKIMAKRCSMH